MFFCVYVFTSTVVFSRKKESYKCDILFIFIAVILLNKNFDVERQSDGNNNKDKKIRSHLILSGLNYYVLASKNKYNVLIVVILYCKTLLLLLRWIWLRLGTGLVVWVKDGLSCEGWVNSVTTNAITEINYRCNYI